MQRMRTLSLLYLQWTVMAAEWIRRTDWKLVVLRLLEVRQTVPTKKKLLSTCDRRLLVWPILGTLCFPTIIIHGVSSNIAHGVQTRRSTPYTTSGPVKNSIIEMLLSGCVIHPVDWLKYYWYYNKMKAIPVELCPAQIVHECSGHMNRPIPPGISRTGLQKQNSMIGILRQSVRLKYKSIDQCSNSTDHDTTSRASTNDDMRRFDICLEIGSDHSLSIFLE